MNDEEQRRQDNQETSALITDNAGYGDSDFLQFRLNTDPLMADLELYLRGERVGYEQDDEGKPVTVRHKIGRQKVNEFGVQSIMAWIQNIVNPHTVTGNLSYDDYVEFLIRQRKRFATYLMVQRIDFELSLNEYSGIIDTLFAAIELIITRPINNLERKSLQLGGLQVKQSSSNNESVLPTSRSKKFGVF